MSQSYLGSPMTEPVQIQRPTRSLLAEHQRPIDNTALTDYMSCPRKFLYAMILHRRKSTRREFETTPALNYGTAWHNAMRVHYSWTPEREAELGISCRDAVELTVMKGWKETGDPEDYRTIDRVMLEYDKYVKHWGDERSETEGWPHRPLVEIATELTWPGAAYPYTGKLDRIIRLNGQQFVEDHKTSSRMESNYFKQWQLSNQMAGYAFMAYLLTGEHIAGVRINLHVCRKTDSQFERQVVTFGKDRLEHWQKNFNYWIGRIETDLDLWEDGNEEAFPHNFSACSGKYGMCGYASVCSEIPRARMRALEQDFDIDPWKPLEADDDA
jgi:CRISPR/Cas system-associated exonuclease Cas4 (RecB family)